MTTFPETIWSYFPHWLAGALAVLLVAVYIIGKLGVAHEGFAKAFASVRDFCFKRSREAKRRRNSVDYQIADLWRQVEFLEEQLAELRLRDEMYWAWILTDQEWHRQHEFAAAENGWETAPHKSFMEFRDEWIANRVTRRIRISKGDSPF